MDKQLQKVDPAAVAIFGHQADKALEWADVYGDPGATLVPDAFRGNRANCAIIAQMAYVLNVLPLQLMQSVYEVHGKIGFDSKYAIGIANQRGPFRGSIKYELSGTGDARKCEAWALHQDDGERCVAECSIAIAKAEGWYNKSGSKWQTMPDVMLRYRSAMFLIRAYCPEVLLGLQTADEIRDIGPEVREMGDVRVVDDEPSRSAATIVVEAIGDFQTDQATVTAAMRARYPAKVDAGGVFSAALNEAIEKSPDLFRDYLRAYIAEQPSRDFAELVKGKPEALVADFVADCIDNFAEDVGAVQAWALLYPDKFAADFAAFAEPAEVEG